MITNIAAGSSMGMMKAAWSSTTDAEALEIWNRSPDAEYRKKCCNKLKNMQNLWRRMQEFRKMQKEKESSESGFSSAHE